MKYLSLIIFIFFHGFCSKAQSDFWLPEKYVHALINKEDDAEKYIIPIASIIAPFTKCSIIGYRGEAKAVKTKKVTINGKEKIQVFDIQYCFPLDEVPKAIIDKYASSIIYLSTVDDKLQLEILNEGSVERIFLINHINKYEFNNYYNTVKDLKSLQVPD